MQRASTTGTEVQQGRHCASACLPLAPHVRSLLPAAPAARLLTFTAKGMPHNGPRCSVGRLSKNLPGWKHIVPPLNLMSETRSQ